jgi:hypothetical protein
MKRDDAPLVALEDAPIVKEATAVWRTAEAASRTAQDGVRALNRIGATGDRIARVEAQQALPKAEAMVAAAEIAMEKAARICETARDAEKARTIAVRHPGAVELAQVRLEAVDALLAAHAECQAYNQEADRLVGSECAVDIGNFTITAAHVSTWRTGQS